MQAPDRCSFLGISGDAPGDYGDDGSLL